MNILFVCDMFPPFSIGGYAQLCSDVAIGLRARGHSVTVLCNEVGNKKKISDNKYVFRMLKAPISFERKQPIPLQQLSAPWRRYKSKKAFLDILDKSGASIVVFWPNMYGDTHLMMEAEKISYIGVSYYTAGVSPTQINLAIYWGSMGKKNFTKIAKSLIKPFFALELKRTNMPVMKHVMCVSEYERQRLISENLDPASAVVIHNGIELDQFRFLGLPSQRRIQGDTLRILYAGRLDETKGAITVIQALSYLIKKNPTKKYQLTLVGSGLEIYRSKLMTEIKHSNISEMISLLPWIEREKMPELMSQYDILVLPTIIPEALPRIVQEAMALGLVVIATDTGGTPEVVRHLETGLLFHPNDFKQLAKYLSLCHDDLNLCDQLSLKALGLIKSDFTMEHMITAFETQLFSLFPDNSSYCTN